MSAPAPALLPDNPNEGRTMGYIPLPPPGLVSKNTETLDPVLKLLFAGLFGAVAVALLCNWWWPNDGQVFMLIAGIVGGFQGSFFTRLKPRGTAGDGQDQTKGEQK